MKGIDFPLLEILNTIESILYYQQFVYLLNWFHKPRFLPGKEAFL